MVPRCTTMDPENKNLGMNNRVLVISKGIGLGWRESRMIIEIPGRKKIEVRDIVFDYNGTIAIDGSLIDGVAKAINELSNDIHFHVITADTYGSVENECKSLPKPCAVAKSSAGIQL